VQLRKSCPRCLPPPASVRAGPVPLPQPRSGAGPGGQEEACCSAPRPSPQAGPLPRRQLLTESQNHSMFRVGRDLCGSLSPTPLPKQGHPGPVTGTGPKRLPRPCHGPPADICGHLSPQPLAGRGCAQCPVGSTAIRTYWIHTQG